MIRKTLWPFVIVGLLTAMSCQSLPASSPAAPAVPPAPTGELDLGHADGAILVVPVRLGAPDSRRVLAWAADVDRLVLRVESAALLGHRPGGGRAGELITEVERDESGRFIATLLNLPASDPARPESLYTVSARAIDRAGNAVNADPGPDGYSPVASGLRVDPHQLTFVPTVQLALMATFVFSSPSPAPIEGKRDKPQDAPVAQAAPSPSAGPDEDAPSPSPAPSASPSASAEILASPEASLAPSPSPEVSPSPASDETLEPPADATASPDAP